MAAASCFALHRAVASSEQVDGCLRLDSIMRWSVYIRIEWKEDESYEPIGIKML